MVITFDRLRRIGFWGLTAVLLSAFIGTTAIFTLILIVSFLHDIIGIGKIEKLPALPNLWDIIKEFFRIKLPFEWADIGCAFLGAFLGTGFIAGLSFWQVELIILIVWLIFIIFAFLSRIAEVKNS